jgi:hypothetical protein
MLRVTLSQAAAHVANIRNAVRAQGREVSAEDLTCFACGKSYPSVLALTLHLEQHEDH